MSTSVMTPGQRRGSRWTSFLAGSNAEKPHVLREDGNPAHRVRVEHNAATLLVHLSGEDGKAWTVMAVDRATRRWAVAQAPRQLDAAEEACVLLYSDAQAATGSRQV